MSPTAVVLTGSWRGAFDSVVASAHVRLTVCAPFISAFGAHAVQSARTGRPATGLDVLILTDLSPMSICTGATDPCAIAALVDSFPRACAIHLPCLHAKAYVADGQRAIVTSGNLTRGGIETNHECGVLLDDATVAGDVEREIAAYAELGGQVDGRSLARICDLRDEARSAHGALTAAASRKSLRRLNAVTKLAGDTLLRARLAAGPLHTVFARTIEFLLQRHGPLTTEQLHPLIQRLHPDLCDDAVDRVIDGRRFGRKWKHAVRSAQQQLKKRGVIALRGGVWTCVR